ncbi:MAG TPA: hypothetical protein VFG07_08975 [Thermoplasmata archaeon]|nr:hypothetical protein [Thermoplasmata archaeon]
MILVAAPIAAYTWSTATWTRTGTSSFAGTITGSGAASASPGQPTIAGVAPPHATFGASATSGTLLGQANYQQAAYAWTSATFTAWKAPGKDYNTSVLYGFQLSPGDVSESVNCLGGGSANATAVIFVEIAVYDVTTGTYAAALGPAPVLAPTGAIGLIAVFATPVFPFDVGCTPGGSASASSMAMSLPALGNLTGPIPIVLTSGNVYQIEGFLGAYVGAETNSVGATATATIAFPPGDFTEIVSAHAW